MLLQVQTCSRVSSSPLSKSFLRRVSSAPDRSLQASETDMPNPARPDQKVPNRTPSSAQYGQVSRAKQKAEHRV